MAVTPTPEDVRRLLLRGALQEARTAAQALARDAEAREDYLAWSQALRDEGVARFERFEFAAATMCFEHSLAIAGSLSSPRYAAELTSWLAATRAADDAPGPAEKLAERALLGLTVDPPEPEESPPRVEARREARTRENLAFALWVLGRHDEARALAHDALGKRQGLQIDDDDALETASAAILMGLVEQAAHRLGPASEAFSGALETRRRILGPRHAYVGYCLHHLAQIELDRGHLDACLELANEAVGIVAQAFGQHHANVASILATVGAARLESGDLAAGRQALERALDVSQRNFGRESPQHGVIQLLLGTSLRALGEPAEAVDLLEAAVRTLTPVHAARAEVLNNCLVSLVDAYVEAEMPNRAVAFLGETALRFDAMPEVDLALHARASLGNAVAQIATGHAGAALEPLRQMAERAELALGAGAPLCVELRAAEAAALEALGQVEEAQAIMRRIENLGELH